MVRDLYGRILVEQSGSNPWMTWPVSDVRSALLVQLRCWNDRSKIVRIVPY